MAREKALSDEDLDRLARGANEALARYRATPADTMTELKIRHDAATWAPLAVLSAVAEIREFRSVANIVVRGLDGIRAGTYDDWTRERAMALHAHVAAFLEPPAGPSSTSNHSQEGRE